ncbi:MAG: hypothetical protein HF978_08140 [Desulfobacteraceae bacterium]|nr:hypothetical protein [Desulfobacteraceae bacterium]MBC2755499.1 hypothetical protein [Desulfobacteraceae bacterium]
MKKDEKNIYLDYIYLMDSLKEYASPKSKLTQMIKSGEVIKVKRGLYLPGGGSWYSQKTLANKLYGPSYLSFEYALSHYNLIPEKVQALTSASYNKNKNKQFKTPVGFFIYRYTNPAVYPYGIVRMEEDGSPFLIATREKAICDTLSKIRGIGSIKQLEALLFDDLRIDKNELARLDTAEVNFLAGIYGKKIISLVSEYMKRGG